MKVRDSGMPGEAMWDPFFDPASVLASLGMTRDTTSAVDLGCGYGTFAIPAARLIEGTVHGFDIEPEMIRVTSSKAEDAGLANVHSTSGILLPTDGIARRQRRLRDALQHPARRATGPAASRGVQDFGRRRYCGRHALGQRSANTPRPCARHPPKPHGLP